MKISEARERSMDELKVMEKDLRRELWRTRFQNHSNQLDDTSKLPRLRKDIARLNTLMNERKKGQTKS